jgi:hypothetical protein
MLAISDFFRDTNLIECALWCVIGIGFLFRAIAKPRQRATALLAGATFLLFGASDYVESHTGAWWRPWWLLVWKGICLLIFLILIVQYIRNRRPQKDHFTTEHTETTEKSRSDSL